MLHRNSGSRSPSGWRSGDRESRKSIDSSISSDRHHHHTSGTHPDEVLDAMGLIHDDSGSSYIDSYIHGADSSAYNDHRRYSDIKPDQKMMRPVRTQEPASATSASSAGTSKNHHQPQQQQQQQLNDAFTQQSKLLSHENDRRGMQPSDHHDYGSTMPSYQNKHSTPFPVPNSMQNNPFLKKTPFPQRNLLSQSAPLSMASDTYTDSKREENSIYASSNPSSRRNSEASSLNDVCFPVDSLDEVDRSKRWPNLSILEEFAREELEDMKRPRSTSTSQRSFSPLDESNVNFQYPIISNVDYGDTEPLIVSTNEEIDPINGRLRPKKRTPWRKPAFITKHDKMTKFRFTYFREDISDTIHSPTISGLLHNGRKFEDLFSPSHYGAVDTIPEEREVANKMHNISNLPIVASTLTNLTQETTTSGNTALNSSQSTKSYVQPFWLDVLNPTEDEMKAISKTFGIHPLTSEDIFLGEAREKVELFKDYYFVCFTSFDVEEEHQRRKQAIEKAFADAMEEEEQKAQNERPFFLRMMQKMKHSSSTSGSSGNSIHSNNSKKSKRSKSATSLTSKKMKKKKYNKDELIPLTMYIVVFRDGVITFHFKPTPHTGNVRRRARLLRDYLTVTSDWVGYALIDDITDAFAPLIESIETEVNSIEDEIITMQSGDKSDESESEDEVEDIVSEDPYWIKVKRRNSNIAGDGASSYSKSISTSSSSSVDTKVISWKKKGDMLRRIGNCRRRVMSLLRLLGSKADVIKGFSKRYNEQWEVAPRSEIGLYLGDIQDHIVTMVQNLNHYEKLLARSHSNYLAQINIDMTRVNNDMNDILGKITILGTIVLPLNIVTGLWGMNCLVPGQDRDDLQWFWMILSGMFAFSITCYYYVKKILNVV